MDAQPHDWRVVRERQRADGLLQVHHCRRCKAGCTTMTDPETHNRRIIASYPKSLSESCPGERAATAVR